MRKKEEPLVLRSFRIRSDQNIFLDETVNASEFIRQAIDELRIRDQTVSSGNKTIIMIRKISKLRAFQDSLRNASEYLEAKEFLDKLDGNTPTGLEKLVNAEYLKIVKEGTQFVFVRGRKGKGDVITFDDPVRLHPGEPRYIWVEKWAKGKWHENYAGNMEVPLHSSLTNEIIEKMRAELPTIITERSALKESYIFNENVAKSYEEQIATTEKNISELMTSITSINDQKDKR